MTMQKKDKSKDKPKVPVVAFVNWETVTKSGQVFKSDRGFPIYKNPEYINAKEDILVAATEDYLKKNPDAKFLELDMKIRIGLNNTNDSSVKASDLF